MSITTITQWQLDRILDLLLRTRTKDQFPQLRVLAFLHSGERLCPVDVEGSRPVVLNPLTGAEIQWYRDTWFSVRHTAVQVQYGDGRLLVGFWTPHLDKLNEWLAKELPHDYAGSDTERVLAGCANLE